MEAVLSPSLFPGRLESSPTPQARRTPRQGQVASRQYGLLPDTAGHVRTWRQVGRKKISGREGTVGRGGVGRSLRRGPHSSVPAAGSRRPELLFCHLGLPAGPIVQSGVPGRTSPGQVSWGGGLQKAPVHSLETWEESGPVAQNGQDGAGSGRLGQDLGWESWLGPPWAAS